MTETAEDEVAGERDTFDACWMMGAAAAAPSATEQLLADAGAGD
jgi:hypothetical protein